MIIYHACSMYQLLCMVVHRMKFNKKENTKLICASYIQDKKPEMPDTLKEIFDDVIVYNPFWECSNKRIKTRYVDYINSILFENDIDFERVKEIYVGGVHLLFGVYLAENNMRFNYFEDAAGLLSRPEILFENEAFHEDRRSLCEYYGLYDASYRNIKHVFCNFSSQDSGFKPTHKMVDYNVTSELYQMNEEDQIRIKQLFCGYEVLSIKEDSIVFLSQHFSNLGLMSFEENIRILKLVFDYFFEGENIVIKTHPDDVINYKKLFPDCSLIRDVFPSEFLPIVFNKKPKKIATISSTAINNLKDYYDDFFTFDFEFQKHFQCIHKYAYVLQFVSDFVGTDQINQIGTDLKLVANLKKIIETKKKTSLKKNMKFSIVDDFFDGENEEKIRKEIIESLERAEEKEVWFFLNNEKKYIFYDYYHKNLWGNIIPICINHKSNMRKKEVLYLFTRNRECIDFLKEYFYKMELKNTDDVVTSQMTNEYELKIKKLEGILDATERRLLWYINKEKEEERKKWS